MFMLWFQVFGSIFILSSLFLTCTKGQRRQLVTPPAQKNSTKEQRQPSLAKDSSFKDIFTKSEKKSDKSSKRESEKSKSGRGKPRDTLVKNWKAPSSNKEKPSIRPAGRNSLQTEPPTERETKSNAPTMADQMEQRSSSRRKHHEGPQSKGRDAKEEEQMSYRSNRLPSLAPTFGTPDPNKNNNSSARVYRSKALPTSSKETVKVEELPQKRLPSPRSQRSSRSKSVKSARQKSLKSEEPSKKEKSSRREKKKIKEEASPWEKLITKGKANQKESATSRRRRPKRDDSKKKKNNNSKSSKRSTREGISKKLFTKPKNKKN